MKLVEPPSCRSAVAAIVFIGRNRRGHWVAQEQNGLFGGLFVNRAQALKYALFENGKHLETIIELPCEIELDLGTMVSQAPATGSWYDAALIQEERMVQFNSVSDGEQAIDTMIALTRPSPLHRLIIAGGDSVELSLALRRRGLLRVATPQTCRTPRGQHAVGLVTGKASEVEAHLEKIVPFLGASATIAVLIESDDGGLCMAVRRKLEQLGFRIEAGARCHRGLVLSATRQGFVRLKSAA